MNPTKSYTQLLAHLKTKFSVNPKRNVRLLGLVFCRPDNKLAREEILPSLAYYHNRSGKYIDFYFAGFDRNAPGENSDVVVHSRIPSKSEWVFNLESFGDFQEQIKSETSWRYSGGSDFMLVNCHYDDKGDPRLDFEGAVVLTFEELRRQNRLPDVGMLFEKIFRHCEQTEGSDEAWGYGLDAVPGSALMELSNSFLNEFSGVNLANAVLNQKEKKEVEAKGNAPQTIKLIVGYFRYDMAKRALIITPSGRKIIVADRYAEVLKQIFKKEDGLYAIRTSCLNFLETATFWEMGRWKKANPSMTDEQLKTRLKQNIMRINDQQQAIARSFDQQFSRWLKDEGIEANSVITYDKNIPGYRLGNGWHPNRMVINDSEAGLKYASHYIEKIAPDDNTGKKTPSYMGTAD